MNSFYSCLYAHQNILLCVCVSETVVGGERQDSAEQSEESSDLLCPDGSQHLFCNSGGAHLLPNALNTARGVTEQVQYT